MSVRDANLGTCRLVFVTCTLCLLVATRSVNAQVCVGDCDGGGTVTVNEMILGVNINLGSRPISACPAFDCDDSGTVPVNCLIQAVNNLLDGCGEPCPLPAGAYTITQVEGGSLRVSTLSPIPFPPGGTITLDVGAASGPACVHNAVVPFPGGFTAPAFCIPAFGFTAKLTQNGCGVGRVASNGGADYGVTELGDTSSQPECNNQQVCMTGVDSKVRVDITVGDDTPDACTSGSANAIFSIPVQTIAWLENSTPPSCPAADGMYNPENGDTLFLDVQQILDFTTDTNMASWMDLSGDGCPLAGVGPAAGLASTGTCWDIAAQTIGIAASGTVGGASLPLHDFTFTASLPNSVSAPQPPQNATCESPPVIDFDGTDIRCLE